MSSPGQSDQQEYRDARGAVDHQPRQDSARRIIVIFAIIILAIGLMLVMWRLALLQT
ncbi:MAG TPA: hypothetical protein VF053_03280 [Streptosporangiales bacterium]